MGLKLTGSRRPFQQSWIRRGAGGLVFGWIWSSLVSLAWVGLAVAAYGDLDLALRRLKGEPWAAIPMTGLFGSVPASLLGGLIGPLVGGSSRRSILNNSARGAAWATALGAVAGLLVGRLVTRVLPDRRLVAYLGLGVSVPAGLIGGCLGGWAARKGDPDNGAELHQ